MPMSSEERWLLPEGIDELLPPAAWRLERLRRELLDLYHSWGYDLVMPPFVEFLESLLVGTGSDLDLQTFKLIDQLSGRMLGVRADMTPQVARIDAHGLKQNHPTRLCYMGTVLHTRNDGFGGSRSPLQVGVELYGHGGLESDREVLLLLLSTLERAAINDVCIDLGHSGIFRGLLQQAALTADREMQLFDILQRKARAELHELVDQLPLTPAMQEMLRALIRLHGGPDILIRARAALAAANPGIHQALDRLDQIAHELHSQNVQVHLDLAELRGYRYHTGLMFSAYVPGQGQEIARGGRYDHIGEAFGRARPATGFSADLKKLLMLGATNPDASTAILAPADPDPALRAHIQQLRQQGERVVQALPGSSRPAGCNRTLVRDASGWTIQPLA